MDKYDVIVEAEQQFAREVTLGVIVTRPLTAWYYIIPGYFIIDFLRRGSAIRQYTKHFMFPRKLALDAAVAGMEEENKQSGSSDVEDKVRIWLESLKLFSEDLVEAHVELVEILAAHYLKLLTAEGDSFDLLLAQAYQDGDKFQQYVARVASAENEVDRQVIERLGGDEMVKEKILAQQEQIAMRRQKILERVF